MMQTLELFLEIWIATLGADIMCLQTCDFLLLDIIKDDILLYLICWKKRIAFYWMSATKQVLACQTIEITITDQVKKTLTNKTA